MDGNPGVTVDAGGGADDAPVSSVDSSESVDSTLAVDTSAPEEEGSEASVVDSPTVKACTNCPLIAQYMAGSISDPTSDISPHFQILNNGVVGEDISVVTLRYWYTEDGSMSQAFACDYTALAGGCASISATFVAMTTPTPTADHYMELSFASGTIPGEGGSTGPIQTRFHDSAYAAMMMQSNDYSFDAADSTYTQSMQVTLYRSGMLVWGVEP